MNIWAVILRFSGWSVDITAPYREKVVICVAPHTSNWDFIMGLLAYRSLGRKASFLMKKFWFFFPLKYFLKALGGIPVDTKKSHSLTSQLVGDFYRMKYLNLAVTPEGSRSPVDKWKTGFLIIAYNAGVPVQLGVIDFKNKNVFIKKEFNPTGDITKDLEEIRKYYSNFRDAARYPDKFIP